MANQDLVLLVPLPQLESLLQRVKDSLAQSSIKTDTPHNSQFDRELDKLLNAGGDNGVCVCART